MDDEPLWNTVYRVVRRVGRESRPPPPPRRGHPDRFATWHVLLVCLLAALRDAPLSRTTAALRDWRWRSGMRRMGYLLPAHLPHRGTVLRRARRGDFADLLARVDRALVTRLGPGWATLVVDSTALPVGPHSRDPDAAWGHHRVRGYRLHTLVTGRGGVVVAAAVHPARVHDQAAAKALVAALAAEARRRRRRVRHLGGDVGYDGEPLHRCVRDALGGAVLVAPFNDRGGRRAMRRTPLRRALQARWHTPAVRRVRRLRRRVERVYSVAKSGRFRLYALPPFVRHLPNVRRWAGLKLVLYHADLVVKQRKRRHE